MAVTQKHHYATLRQVFVKIYSEEGMLTFYRGFVPTVLGVIPYAGVSFFTYDTLKRLYRGNSFNNSALNSVLIFYLISEQIDSNPLVNPLASLGFGAIAGMLGQTSSYPLDIVRRRMQTDTEKRYTSILKTLKTIYV